MAYLRFAFMPSEPTMPTRASRVINTGSSKVSPKAKIRRMTRDRYWSTLASSWMGRSPPPPMASKLRKNFQASGKMK